MKLFYKNTNANFKNPGLIKGSNQIEFRISIEFLNSGKILLKQTIQVYLILQCLLLENNIITNDAQRQSTVKN